MNIQYLLVLLFACAAGGMTYVLAGESFRKPRQDVHRRP
mgnify:CR=1 FL=1